MNTITKDLSDSRRLRFSRGLSTFVAAAASNQPTFTIRKIEDPKSYDVIFRLRYAVLITEMRHPCTEHARGAGLIRDEADETGHIFAASAADGAILGTLRSNFLRDGIPYPFDALLRGLDGAITPDDTFSITSRLIVRATHRRTAIMSRLATAAFQNGLDHGIHHDLIFVQPQLVCTYLRMGYRATPCDSLPHPQAGTVVPLVLNLRDWDYLTSIGSLFRRAPSFRKI